MKRLHVLTAVAAASLLAACGGGGGDGPKARLSLSTQQITVSASTDEPAPTATLHATLANPRPAGRVPRSWK